MGRHEAALLFDQAPQRDWIVELLDSMERAGYDREKAARGLLRALHEPIRGPLEKTGP